MSRDKQIEEMARTMCGMNKPCILCELQSSCLMRNCARLLYAEGYRKSTDVAREIFAELELKAPFFCANQIAYEHFNEELAELKKKYESEGADDER